MVQQLPRVRATTARKVPGTADKPIPLGFVIRGGVQTEQAIHRLRRTTIDVSRRPRTAQIPPNDVMVGEGRRLEGADHVLAGTTWTAGIDEKSRLGGTLSRFALERQGNCWTVRVIPIQRHRDVRTLERPAVMPRNLAR